MMSESRPILQVGAPADGSHRPMTFLALLWERRWFWLGPPLVMLGMFIALILLD